MPINNPRKPVRPKVGPVIITKTSGSVVMPTFDPKGMPGPGPSSITRAQGGSTYNYLTDITDDTFETYTANTHLETLNGGNFWQAAYESRTPFYVIQDDFETYTAAADLGGLNAGENWDAAYVSRGNYHMAEDTLESYADADPLDGLNAGTSWLAAFVSR